MKSSETERDLGLRKRTLDLLLQTVDLARYEYKLTTYWDIGLDGLYDIFFEPPRSQKTTWMNIIFLLQCWL